MRYLLSYHLKGGRPPEDSLIQFKVVDLSPCAVAVHVLEVIIPCCFELFSDETESEHPASEGVGFVFGLLRLRARKSYLLCKVVDCEAKLDECLGFPCVKTVLFSILRHIVLEASKFNGSVSVEKAVQVKDMVAASVVVLCSAVILALCLVPEVFKLAHGLRLSLVDLLQEIRVYRFAVASHSVVVDADGFYQL